jgi:hypothetical protein
MFDQYKRKFTWLVTPNRIALKTHALVRAAKRPVPGIFDSIAFTPDQDFGCRRWQVHAALVPPSFLPLKPHSMAA